MHGPSHRASRRLDVLHAHEPLLHGRAVAAVLLGPPGGHPAALEDGGEGEAVAAEPPHALQPLGRGRVVVLVAPGDHAAGLQRRPAPCGAGHVVHVGERAAGRVAPSHQEAVVAEGGEATLVGKDLLHL